MDDSITITLVSADSGQSESIPLSAASTTLSDLQDWCKALFGLDDNGATLVLFKDGRPLTSPATTMATTSRSTITLAAAGIQNGDLLAVQIQKKKRTTPSSATATATTTTNTRQSAAVAPTPPSPAAATGGLDFSSLLASVTSAPTAATAATAAFPNGSSYDTHHQEEDEMNHFPVYYPGMNLAEATEENPHPTAIVKLLLEKEHLWKELRYHNPSLAQKILGKTVQEAAEVWRREMVAGSIQQAMAATNKYHKEQEMKRRLASNPNDVAAKEYFEKLAAQAAIHEQYRQMMQEYPESLGRVLMLYVEAKINGHAIQAFCDSGAQSTIMSKRLATETGLLHMIDTRFAGTAVGVGTGKILGRIHIVQLQMGDYYFPCSVTVMDDPPAGASEMPFLLGLDMMKRHLCLLDLERGCLKFRVGPGQYMETAFLHEKDLSTEQGGTQGFNAERANQELEQQLQKLEQEEEEADAAKQKSNDETKKNSSSKSNNDNGKDEDAMKE